MQDPLWAGPYLPSLPHQLPLPLLPNDIYLKLAETTRFFTSLMSLHMLFLHL